MISNLIYFFIFSLGLAVGSFLNCLIYRLETGPDLLKRRSFCPYCKNILSWPDLIPILSFLFLKGKCRYCQQKISRQYPLVEIATAIIFLLISLTISNFYTMVYLLLISCFLIVIFVYDLKHYLIPDKLIYPAIFLAFLYQLSNFSIFLNPLLSAILSSAPFLLIVLISKGKWLGLGDVKLTFFMGLFLGFPNILVALFFSFLIGAIIGMGLVISRQKTLKSEIPFGPFLVTGTFISLFWGQQLISWYQNLFLL